MSSLKKRVYLLISFVVVFNILAWVFLLGVSHFSLSLLSLGSLAYFFGLRHAFDADHIAAIDNVTRKLRQDGKKSVGVGLFFSLGHSSVVLLLSIGIVISIRVVSSHLHFLESIGSFVGTSISALFLTLIGIINLFILKDLYKIFKAHKNSNNIDENMLNKASQELLNKRGFFNRIFQSAYKRVNKSYQMYPIGFLFGLGFDTATEVGVLGISSALATNSHLPIWGILVFPVLFAAGMSLMDSLDGLVMMKIYDWAMVDAMRKIFFNMVVTGTSVFVALSIGLIEWLQVTSMQLKINTPFFNYLNNLQFEILGLIVVIIMIVSWFGAFMYYRKYILVREIAN
ncbi:MAG: HoxN/HupN/NixA family nickel/cobalt transporter [Epsilonproteobacteria bacterium]|nr:HoxN/HupN/NixA family nickel/cobalt transporter [Campylobacterota bacterium]